MKPATPLPWEHDPTGKHYARAVIRHNGMISCRPTNDQDAAYIAHAANMYPKLVAALEGSNALLQKIYDEHSVVGPPLLVTENCALLKECDE